jgi:uroporphyrinogen decarboxylase
VGDAAASLISPQYYADEVAPREKKIVEAIQGAGATVRLHICGNIQGKYEAIAGLNVDFVDIDFPQTVEEVREGVGPDLVLAGNVNPVAGIKDSTPEKIQADFAECHQQAGENYILAAGCEVPPDTPEENVKAMFEYARSVT